MNLFALMASPLSMIDELTGFALLFFWLVLIVLTVMLPVSVYCAQKWAYKCYQELKKLNKNLESMNR